MRGRKKIFHAKGDDKKAGVAILISDKIDFKTKAIKKYKEGNYILMKGSIQEEDFTLVNIYAPNIGEPKYIKQILTDIKGEIDGNTIIVGDFNTQLTSIDLPDGRSIATEILNDTIELLDLIDIVRTLHPKKPRIHIFFQCTWNIL